jgi:hypothetical protein
MMFLQLSITDARWSLVNATTTTAIGTGGAMPKRIGTTQEVSGGDRAPTSGSVASF